MFSVLKHHTFHFRGLAFLSILFALAGCETLREAPDSDTFIFLDSEETLYVRLVISSDLAFEHAYPDIANSTKDRRYEQFFASMRTLLQVYRFPMDVRLLEELEPAGDGPLLDLHAIRWEQDRMGDINTVLRARLERYGKVNTLGVFRERETPAIMSSFERTEQVFAQTMESALSQMFLELNRHFETAEEEAYLEEGLELQE